LSARRKVIVKPVLGQSKEAHGFRRGFLRGVAHSRGAWRLVCLTQNLRKIWRYGRMLRVVSTVWSPPYVLAMVLLSMPWR
jgi:hypothetical protein